MHLPALLQVHLNTLNLTHDFNGLGREINMAFWLDITVHILFLYVKNGTHTDNSQPASGEVIDGIVVFAVWSMAGCQGNDSGTELELWEMIKADTNPILM